VGLTEEQTEELKALSHKNKSEIEDKELTRLTKNALKRKFDYPEWGLFFEVKGKNGKMADAIAYNLYPSRNWRTIGMEVKVSRSDWKKEKQTASKNDWFVGQVDEFYVVAGRKGIVKESELPEGWGLYEMKGGGKLYQVKDSDLTEHQDREMDEEFYMRGVKKAVEQAHSEKVSKKRAERKAFRKGKKAGKEEGDVSRKQKKLIKKGKKFKKLDDRVNASLYRVDDDTIEKFNKAVKLVDKLDSGSYGGLTSRLSSLKSNHEKLAEQIAEVEDLLQGIDSEFELKSEEGLMKFQQS